FRDLKNDVRPAFDVVAGKLSTGGKCRQFRRQLIGDVPAGAKQLQGLVPVFCKNPNSCHRKHSYETTPSLSRAFTASRIPSASAESLIRRRSIVAATTSVVRSRGLGMLPWSCGVTFSTGFFAAPNTCLR